MTNVMIFEFLKIYYVRYCETIEVKNMITTLRTGKIFNNYQKALEYAREQCDMHDPEDGIRVFLNSSRDDIPIS